MVCRDFILTESCKPCPFLWLLQFAQLILPYQRPNAYTASLQPRSGSCNRFTSQGVHIQHLKYVENIKKQLHQGVTVFHIGCGDRI